MRILYWDAFAGISGDMSLGSLIALGADPENIVDQLHSLGLSAFELKVSSRQVQGISATDIDVVVLPEHDHQTDHSQGHNGHSHLESNGHPHRRLPDICDMILGSRLSDRAKANALRVFQVLAEAEAHIHGTTVDHVHFHEVGAVDSIVDIVGTTVALDLLDIDEIVVSTLPWSTGFVTCAHGIIPVPAPATLEILHGFAFKDSGITGELITPTGASIVKALGRQGPFPNMTVIDVGYGAGKNYYGIPSLLRAVLGQR